MTTTATTPAAAAARARALFGKVRTVERNYRLKRYQGRNSHSTEATRAAWEAEAWGLVRELPRELGGLVTAEHRLAGRLSENRDQGVARPELEARLKGLRRELRAALAA